MPHATSDDHAPLTADELQRAYDKGYLADNTGHEEGLREVAAAVLRALPPGVHTSMSLHALADAYEDGPISETDVAEDE